MDWRKSTYSGGQGGDCVETASSVGAVLVRDTKDNGNGPVLAFSADAWATFTARLS